MIFSRRGLKNHKKTHGFFNIPPRPHDLRIDFEIAGPEGPKINFCTPVEGHTCILFASSAQAPFQPLARCPTREGKAVCRCEHGVPV